MARLRTVVETSSLVRAALNADSAAGRPIERLLSADSDSQIVVSSEIDFELMGVLARPKFTRRLAQDYRRRSVLGCNCVLRRTGTARRGLSRSADHMMLEAALAFGNDVIVVSDDRDLLVLDPWRDIRIVKPEAALATYQATAPVNRGRGAQP